MKSHHIASAILAAAAIAASGFGPLAISPTHAQTVELVRVDIATVGKGYRATKLVGSMVVNDSNEDIGKLDEIVIGQDEGRAMYAIVDVGGFLKLGSHLVAVPYQSLKMNDGGRKITLPGATRDGLKNLAEFKYASTQGGSGR